MSVVLAVLRCVVQFGLEIQQSTAAAAAAVSVTNGDDAEAFSGSGLLLIV